MNKEEKEVIKMSFPLFTSNEEAQLENMLNFHLDEFVNEINKTMSKDKDIIVLKKVIERQAKEIERQDRNIHKLNLDKIQQQKEIEELKTIIKAEIVLGENFPEDTKMILMCKKDFLRNYETAYISKDKIRGKIEQLEIVKNTPVKDNNYTYKECIEYGIEELKELLEE